MVCLDAATINSALSRFEALTAQILSLIENYATDPKEQEYYQHMRNVVNEMQSLVAYRLNESGSIEWKRSNIQDAEAFFKSAQDVIQAQDFKYIIETTSSNDAQFPARIANIDRFTASANRLGNSRRPPAPGEVQVRGGIPKNYGHVIYNLIDTKFRPAPLSPWFDFGEVQSWITRCDDSHEQCKLSSASKQLLSAYPTWLIDTRRMCLVKGAPGLQYVALSYLCDSEGFKTKKDSLTQLQQTGALDASTEKEIIPPTIFHAIQFTSRLNTPYLWVDSLCIPHDDEAQLHHELLNMASIFANAEFTLVIPTIPAAGGLYGIEGATLPIANRDYFRPRWWEAPNKLSTRIAEKLKILNDVSWGSPWRKRAWTYQEYLFSRKLLIVDENSVVWQCHCQMYFEGVDTPDKTSGGYRENGQGLKILQNPSFKDYGSLVSSLNNRILINPEDSLLAFGGIMGALGASWQGTGWISGLPTQFFDLALLWYNEKPLTKRIVTQSDLLVPSWSWAAWQGPITFLDEPNGKDWIKSLVEWKVCPARRIWTPISALSKTPKGTNQSTDSDLLNAMDSLNISGSSAPKVVNGAPITSFMPYLLSASVPYLRLHVMEFATSGIPLINKEGECIGMVTPNESIPPVRNIAEITCEIVAISELSMDGMELYNVLWIEQSNGISYRRGVGRVVKEMWLAMKPTIAEIVLG